MFLNSVQSILFIFLFSIYLQNQVSAQVLTSIEKTPKNSISLVLIGHTLTYALQYERTFIDWNKFKTVGQIGLSYNWRSNYLINKGRISLPVTISQLFRTKKGEFLEIGTGVLLAGNIEKNESSEANAIWIGRLGYRFQMPKKHFNTKILYTPFFENNKVVHLLGIEIGYRF